MEVKDWENLVLNTEVGSHCFVTLIDDKDISRGYAQIRRAEHFGYTSASPGYMEISFISKK